MGSDPGQTPFMRRLKVSDQQDPRVYVDESGRQQRTIAGVDTSTAAFAVACRLRPRVPQLVTSLTEFEREFGDGGPLIFSDGVFENDAWHAARAFFAEGGKRLYVSATAARADGTRPQPEEYEAALRQLDPLLEVSILAAPGSTRGEARAAAAVGAVLVQCAERTRRFAILDPADGQTVADIRTFRSAFDSGRAALYYPWVRAAGTSDRQGVLLPPSGFVAGIYARTDAARGVHASPADEPVQTAVGLEHDINDFAQGLLNPDGINCIRRGGGWEGIRVRGARTLSAGPDWKYVNVRRYITYVQESIGRGTQWAVFEPNGEALWQAVRSAVDAFLFGEWRRGALLGNTVDEAFFVRCDRTTMTQADIDEGRLICLVGIATVRPAEFVIFRIAQRTVEAGWA